MKVKFKIIKIKEFKVTLKVLVTNECLIPCEDGRLSLNFDGSYVCFIATALTQQYPFKTLKFDSKPFLMSLLTPKMWDDFYDKCSDYCKKHILKKGVNPGQIAYKIRL